MQELRPYGVGPKTIRIGDELGKGYLEVEMTEMFRRYNTQIGTGGLMAGMRERTAEADRGARSDGAKEHEPSDGKQGGRRECAS